jgi:glucose-6-phosphate isomerase
MKPTEAHAWEKLAEHQHRLVDVHMREHFAQDPDRFQRFSVDWNGDVFFDYSKHRIDAEAFKSLMDLAHEMGLEERRAALFAGAKINATEHRAVMHMALRSTRTAYQVDGTEVMDEVTQVRDAFLDFADRIREGEWNGYTGKRITDVVNIGIGGSDLGPRMVTRALQDLQPEHLNVHYVANVDGADITEVLQGLRPDTTLFLIASKTFTTQETMTNAHTARRWFLSEAQEADIPKHFAALSTNAAGVSEFGIAAENMFPFWEWVGGRYSLWSSIGLSTAISIGSKNFRELLAGAEAADEHFRDTPFEKNIPVLMAMLGVWYQNFWGARTQAIIAYDQRLEKLAPYLQQADMESNGKRVDKQGNEVNYRTGAVVWGEPGTNGQHAFFQLIHQGTQLIFCDFIAAVKPGHGEKDHHRKLWANFLAQTEAMMKGKTEAEVRAELTAAGLAGEALEKLVPFKEFPGNIPTSSIVLKELTPFHLGALVAFYEHKIFTQGVIWNIHSYDQWGVELGKQLAKNILPELEDPQVQKEHDASTRGLIEYAHRSWPNLSE